LFKLGVKGRFSATN